MSKKQKEYKCRYSHCRHPEDLGTADKMVKVSNMYYHPECEKERRLITEIVDYYREYIDDRVTVSQLRSIVNNIIFKKKVPAQELFFDIKYVHETKQKINSPLALHYIITNKKVRAEYAKYKAGLFPETRPDEVEVSEETKFSAKTSRNDGFSSIF